MDMQTVNHCVLTGKRIAFLSLGCKVNSYETDRMREEFLKAGATVCDFETPGADVIIINTCSVTNIADRKSRQMLHRARRLSPGALVVAAGCYAEAKGSEEVEATDADIAVGNSRKNDILRLVAEALITRQEAEAKIQDTPERAFDKCGESLNGERSGNDPETGDKKLSNASQFISDHTRAFIKIQDGCNQFCSYCIIPYVRGRVSSRTDEDVLGEIEASVHAGFKEVVLTGIHLSSYGIDRYEYEASKGFDSKPLLELIKKAASINGLERIRLGSLEPRIITEDLTRELAALDRFCPQFHLSLQSGSDSVLKRMNRHYTTQDYLKSVEMLKSAFYLPAITTDIIVGFPGETDDEFEETLKFAEKVGFLKIHVFKYSRRKGTAADAMPEQLDESLKSQRSSKLLKIDTDNRNRYLSQFVNTDEEVLFEQIVSDGGKEYLTGLTKRYAEVRCVCEEPENLINTIRRCRITAADKDGFLRGTVI